MVGGGNYIEYQNLQDYAKPRPPAPPKRIVYGCTELVNASQFLEQVGRCLALMTVHWSAVFVALQVGSITFNGIRISFHHSRLPWVVVVNKLLRFLF